MFDEKRFTDEAKKVMILANQEAQRFNHREVRAAHILIGLIKEGSGVGATTLKNMGLDFKKIRREVERLLKSGPDMVIQGKLSQTPRAKKVIEFATEEARSLNCDYVATEHLLLGLLRVENSKATEVLIGLGLKLEDVRQETLNLIRQETLNLIGDNIKEEPKKENSEKCKIFNLELNSNMIEVDINNFLKTGIKIINRFVVPKNIVIFYKDKDFS